MASNPMDNWSIEDVQSVCGLDGIQCIPPKRGRHFKITHPSMEEILTIPANRRIRPVYIRKLVEFIELVREIENG
jgi:hypothetical protein